MLSNPESIVIYFFHVRYLTFPPGEFAAGPAKSGLLTQHESFAILMNISSPGSWELPDYMNTETEARKIPRDLVPMLSSGKMSFYQGNYQKDNNDQVAGWLGPLSC